MSSNIHNIDTEQRIAFFALVCGAAAIGFAPIFVRLSEVGPTATAFWRVLLALPALGIGLAIVERKETTLKSQLSSKKRFAWATRRSLLIILLTGIFFAADLAVWHTSIKFTTVANSTLLANFAPIFVTIGGWVLFRQRVTRLFIGGLATALMGAILLVGGSMQLEGKYLAGDALGLLTAVFYGGYILSLSWLRKAGVPVVAILFGAGIISTLLLLPVTLAAGEALWPMTLRAWCVLLGVALVSHVSGQGLITYSLAHLPAAFSSVTLLLQPVLAAVFAWVLLSEKLGAFHICGGLIVLAGIFLARMGSINQGGTKKSQVDSVTENH